MSFAQNRAFLRIPLIFKMTLYSASFFLLLFGIIILSLKWKMNLEWEKQNTKAVQQLVHTVKNNYPDISNIQKSGTQGSTQFSIYSYSNEKLIYTSNSKLNFSLSPLNSFIFTYEGNAELEDENNELDWAVFNQLITINNTDFIIQVAINREAEFFSDGLVNNLFTVLIPLSIFAAFLSTFLALRGSLKQINRITRRAEEISANRLDQLIPETGTSDELGRLTIQFNKMIKRLHKNVEEQKRFVDDASHELRTPLAALTGFVNILDRWGSDNTDVKEEAMTAIKNECFYMEKLIGNLLLLSRNEEDKVSFPSDFFKVELLLKTVEERMGTAFPGRNIITENSCREEFYGPIEAMEQVLQILVENSLNYDRTGNDVIIKTHYEKNDLFITVKDRGPGLKKDDMERVFDRFYRVDKARSRVSGGSGLGLSIAKALMNAMNGSIYFVPQDTGALCTARFPKMPPS